jgi:hypothetical protein
MRLKFVYVFAHLMILVVLCYLYFGIIERFSYSLTIAFPVCCCDQRPKLQNLSFEKIDINRNDRDLILNFNNLIKSIQKSKDTLKVISINLNNSSYNQFISILNTCMINKIDRFVYDSEAGVLFIYSDNVIRLDHRLMNKDIGYIERRPLRAIKK